MLGWQGHWVSFSVPPSVTNFHVLEQIYFLSRKPCLKVVWDNWDEDVHWPALVLQHLAGLCAVTVQCDRLMGLPLRLPSLLPCLVYLLSQESLEQQMNYYVFRCRFIGMPWSRINYFTFFAEDSYVCLGKVFLPRRHSMHMLRSTTSQKSSVHVQLQQQDHGSACKSKLSHCVTLQKASCVFLYISMFLF